MGSRTQLPTASAGRRRRCAPAALVAVDGAVGKEIAVQRKITGAIADPVRAHVAMSSS